jgi:Tfp pilus assembly protein PilF
MRHAAPFLALAIWMTIAPSCQWPVNQAVEPAEYRTLARDPSRDTQAAREHNARGAELLEKGHPEPAEEELKEALAADLFFGPAHNNLGIAYFRQKKHYLAAWEFQYAAKLMPSKAEPRNNLGMVFEAVERLEDAANWYEKALALEPGEVEIAANLARIYVRHDRKDEKTRQLLQDIVMKDSRPQWIEWARERLAMMGKSEDKKPVKLEELDNDSKPKTP